MKVRSAAAWIRRRAQVPFIAIARIAATIINAMTAFLVGAALIGGGIYGLVGGSWTMIYAGIVVVWISYMLGVVERQGRGQQR